MKKEFKNYDNEPKNKDEDSLLFWKNKGSKERYPILSEVVKMIGSIQATILLQKDSFHAQIIKSGIEEIE